MLGLYPNEIHWSCVLKANSIHNILKGTTLLKLAGNRYRSSHPEVFLEKGLLKICSKFTGEHPCRIELTFQHGCSPVNLLHIFRTPFIKNTSGRLQLEIFGNISKLEYLILIVMFFNLMLVQFHVNASLKSKSKLQKQL